MIRTYIDIHMYLFCFLFSGISSVVRRCSNKETAAEFAVKIIDKLSKKGQDVKGIDITTQTYAEVNALSKLKGHDGISI